MDNREDVDGWRAVLAPVRGRAPSQGWRSLGVALLCAAAVGAHTHGVFAAGAGGIATCTVTAIRLVAVRTSAAPGVALLSSDGHGGCFGAYVFNGVTAHALGYANVTTDDYGELAALLRHWSPADGGPAVSEWVDLSPTLAAGMAAAGIDSVALLQWLNAYNSSAWAGQGAGAVTHDPPLWPTFLPRRFVPDPATAAGAPRRSVRPGGGSGGWSGSAVRAGPTGVRATLSPHSAEAPPSVVTAAGMSVPCVVDGACRTAVGEHDRWRALPPIWRQALALWWRRRVAIGVGVMVGALVGGGWAVARALRNRRWYHRFPAP